MSAPAQLVRAPGRVNLIGDHTDYTGGLVFPMAIDRWTEIRFVSDDRIVLSSADEDAAVDLPLSVVDPASVTPAWGRYVAGVVSEMSPSSGIRGNVSTTVPIGAGLSSSAALEVAVALALGFEGTPQALAQLCRRAEIRASGVPCGIMDQLSIAAGVADHALLIDCHALTVTPTPLPDGIEVIVEFIAHRTLIGSPYADRVRECALAELEIGPLRLAKPSDAAQIHDPVVRNRATHVITENQRVRDFAAALLRSDVGEAGRLMIESHQSLRDQFGLSTAAMDMAVERFTNTRGVHGARMTGGGFGGCIVALAEPGAVTTGWVVHASAGAERLKG